MEIFGHQSLSGTGWFSFPRTLHPRTTVATPYSARSPRPFRLLLVDRHGWPTADGVLETEKDLKKIKNPIPGPPPLHRAPCSDWIVAVAPGVEGQGGVDHLAPAMKPEG